MKVEMSKCSNDGSYIWYFQCIICGRNYVLINDTCEGVVCCDCEEFLNNPTKYKSRIQHNFDMYKKTGDYIHTLSTYGLEQVINTVRGYLEMISNQKYKR